MTVSQIKEDAALEADLARAGLVVTSIHRTMDAGSGYIQRLIVATRDAHGLPLVAVVNRGPSERDEAFARLMTKAFVR
jgi:hypothetical protein